MRKTDDDTPRQLPYDVDVEQALLGAILVDQHSLKRVATTPLQPEHFYDPLHQRLYEAAMKMWGAGHAVTPLTLKAMMEGDAGFAEVGGQLYLKSLAQAASVMPNVIDYAAILSDLNMRRRMISVGEDLVNAAFDTRYEAGAAAKIGQQATSAIFEVTRYGGRGRPSKTAHALSVEVLLEHEQRLAGKKIPTMPTGLASLDAELGGFRGTDLVIVPGRPGMGKSVLVNCISTRVALAGYPAFVFSLEMNEKQWIERTLCDLDYDALAAGHSGLEYRKFRNSTATAVELDRALYAQNRLAALPLEICDDDSLTIEDMTARSLAFAMDKGPLGLIAVDYTQIIKPSDLGREVNREREVAHIARGLKSLAKQTGWTVIAAAQIINKNAEERRPIPSDIRESGAIEMEADIIMFPYREGWYVEQRRKDARKGGATIYEAWKAEYNNVKHNFELIMSKNRHGRTRDFDLWCDIGSNAVRDKRPITNAVNQQEAMDLL